MALLCFVSCLESEGKDQPESVSGRPNFLVIVSDDQRPDGLSIAGNQFLETPHLDALAQETAVAGKTLEERLTIYPGYVRDALRWLDPGLHSRVAAKVDAAGYPLTDSWRTGDTDEAPARVLAQFAGSPGLAGTRSGASELVV